MSFQKKTLIAIGLFVGIAGLGFALAIVSARPRASALHKAVKSEQNSLSRPPGRVQVVSFTLYDVGILPRQASAERGFVTVVVEDLSGGTTGLVIERDIGQGREVTGQVRRRERTRHGREELWLEPGSYHLYMADRPENRAELIVEP